MDPRDLHHVGMLSNANQAKGEATVTPRALGTNVSGGMLTQLHCACIPPDRYSLSTFRTQSRGCLLVTKLITFFSHIGSIRHGCFKAAVPDGSSGFASPGYAVKCKSSKGRGDCDTQGAGDECVRWNAHATPLRVHSTGQILSIDLPDATTRMLACN